MSIPVKIEDLATALNDFDAAYLLSVGSDGGIKVVCVDVEVDGSSLVIPTASRGTAANLRSNASVTLMCPPRQLRGYTLLVDGTAVPAGDGFRMSPSAAVLHRPASHADGPVASGGCGHDCAPVTSDS